CQTASTAEPYFLRKRQSGTPARVSSSATSPPKPSRSKALAMAIDWNKPIRTRDGQKARLACVRKHERLPMVVLIDQGHYEGVEGDTGDGRFNLGGEESSLGLVNYDTVTSPECWVVWWPIALSHAVHSSLDS